jgi:hypothetical protein
MEIQDRTAPADPDVPVRIYRPHRAQGAVVWLHGGGFVTGDLETEHPWAVRVADGSGTVMVAVGYRLAPEQRLPAVLDDAYAADPGPGPQNTAIGAPTPTSNWLAAQARNRRRLLAGRQHQTRTHLA